MTRLLGLIVYNWPLKLAALALATLLYAGLIVSQNAQTIPVSVPIQAVNQQPNTITIGSLGDVTEVRYFVADQSNVTITNANFTASVDLAKVEPGPQTQSVRVNVASADPRIQVISATPAFISVHLETVKPKDVPVVVAVGTVPAGLAVRPPQQSLQTATVRGAESAIARVSVVRATVTIDTSGIDVDGEFPLTAVDELGEPVRGVDVEPGTVHVTMPVFKDVRTATVPIVPTIVGNVAPGFEVQSVTTSAPVLSIEGDPGDLANVAEARTKPVSIDGRTSDLDETVTFDLPQGVTAVNPTSVQVHVTLRAVAQTRSLTAGIVLAGARSDRVYSLSIQSAVVTLGGTPADLDRLAGSTVALTANVANLDVGVHPVDLSISLPGITVVAISPATVTVTVAAGSGPSASATPS